MNPTLSGLRWLGLDTGTGCGGGALGAFGGVVARVDVARPGGGGPASFDPGGGA